MRLSPCASPSAISPTGRSEASRAISRLAFIRRLPSGGAALSAVAGHNWMAGFLPPRRADEMLEEYRVGDRADAARHGRYAISDLSRALELDVADDAPA